MRLLEKGKFTINFLPASKSQIKPPFAVPEYLVNEIPELYRLQGVRLNDKHVEVIVRQMMRKVTIIEPGDTKFLEGDVEEKIDFMEENEAIYEEKFVEDAGEWEKFKPGMIVTLREIREENSLLKRADKGLVTFRDAAAATSHPLFLGITKVSLSTRSRVSAASFQETAKVLSQLAISCAATLW